MARLRAAGMGGLPVVERDDQYVFGVDLSRVAELVGLSYDAAPVLSPAALVSRYRTVLEAAVRFARQVPDVHLDDKLPHRDRTYLTLINHLIQIAADFLEIAAGADFTERLAASLPEVNASVAELADRVEDLQGALTRWLQGADDEALSRTVVTYFGDQSLHQVLERAVWHSAQHVRQLMMVLELLRIEPRNRLTNQDLADLPMPENVWDG